MSWPITRPIRIVAPPTIFPKITILRTFTCGLSGSLSMTRPAEETRNVKDMDDLLEIVRASTN